MAASPARATAKTAAGKEWRRRWDAARYLTRYGDESRARGRAWYYRNREYAIKKRQALYALNHERELEHAAEYRKRPGPAQKIKEHNKNYYHADPGAARERWNAWSAANPEKVSAIQSRRRARRLNADGDHSADDIMAIARAQRFRCAYCRKKLKKCEITVDHIKALSKQGSNDRRNLQIACKPCNSQKRSKDPIDFARQKGLLL